MNMAGEHPACPGGAGGLQSSTMPAGGRSRPGAAWVGRIRSTAEKKSEGCNLCNGVCVNAEAELSY